MPGQPGLTVHPVGRSADARMHLCKPCGFARGDAVLQPWFLIHVDFGNAFLYRVAGGASLDEVQLSSITSVSLISVKCHGVVDVFFLCVVL